MSDLINRKDAIDSLTSIVEAYKGIYGDLGGAVSGVRELIKSLPSAEPEQTAKVVRKTKTYNLPTAIPHVIDTREEWWDECENCNTTVQPSDRYCAHCGARLEWK